jgi:RNAse (barnase) inhibitor barstar
MVNVVEIDGSRFRSLEEFFVHFGERALSAPWGHNLDAFNDVLRGGFGTPEGGFTLRWSNHSISRQRLGYEETVHQLERRLLTCHPDNRAHVVQDLATAKNRQGPTAFDWLLEIIREHGTGGSEAEDQVELQLL